MMRMQKMVVLLKIIVKYNLLVNLTGLLKIMKKYFYYHQTNELPFKNRFQSKLVTRIVFLLKSELFSIFTDAVASLKK